MSRIGFIGLGNMGAPMAANLAKAGHDVIGFDVADVTVEGVAKAESAAAAATARDLVITMLPDGPILRAVYDQIVPAAPPGACLVDCSTVDVESSRAAHEMAAKAGNAFGRRAGFRWGRGGDRRDAYLHGRRQ